MSSSQAAIVALGSALTGAVIAVVGRTQKGKNFWYEVQKNGRVAADTQSYPLSELDSAMFKPYVKKLIKNFDQRQQARDRARLPTAARFPLSFSTPLAPCRARAQVMAWLTAGARLGHGHPPTGAFLIWQALDSGMAIRPITAAEILQHLSDFGIDSQLAHGKIRQMSGGQRQRLVICAAFWSKPHVIALDEPTNYLDNDSVAALTKALKDFKGAVVTVSENEAFVDAISNEKLEIKDAKVVVTQLRDAKAR